MATNKVIKLHRGQPSPNTSQVNNVSCEPVYETGTRGHPDQKRTPCRQLLRQLSFLAQAIEQDVKNLTGNYPPHSER